MNDAQFCYAYARMSVTVDILIVRKRGLVPEILLIERKHPPFENCWALPGGFVDMDETAEAAARREAKEETGITLGELRFIGYFDAPNRDPRGRTLSLAFSSIITDEKIQAIAGDDAARAAWFALPALPALAFDHAEIIRLGTSS